MTKPTQPIEPRTQNAAGEITFPTKYAENGYNGNNLPVDIEQRLNNAIAERRVGMASTFTEEKALTILEAILDGSTIKEAAEKAGTTRKTFYVWRECVPGFGDMVKQARKLQAESMADDGVLALESVDVENADPKQAMALLRRAEQVTRFKFDLAKCYNFELYGDKKQALNVNVNTQVNMVDLSKYLNK